MADRIYRQATPVVAGQILAKNGVMIVGGGTADLKFYKPVDYSSGLSIGGMGVQSATDHFQTFTGTVQGAVIPISVHTLVRADAGTTVYKLA